MNKYPFLALLPTPYSLLHRLAVFAVLCLMGNVWALDNVPYLDENGVERTANGVTVIEANGGERTLSTGWYLVIGTFTNDGTITIDGTVHLILGDGSKLVVTGSSENAGIDVSSGNNLSVYAQSTGDSMGKLTATGGSSGAGIGGGYGNSGGTVTITGGTVTATGGSYSAGIGGGILGNGGTVTISGGTVVANGHYGIGGDGGIVTISGGTVTATSNGYYGSGIGGSYVSNGGTVTISGGTVVANGNAGRTGTGIGSSGGTVTITSGTVTANGSYAGINGTVTISGGTVTATGNISGTVTVTGGTVAATSGISGTFTLDGNAVVFASSVGATGENITLKNGILFIFNIGTGTILEDTPIAAHFPEEGVTAVWKEQGGKSGIAYKKDNIESFIEVPGVTVIERNFISNVPYIDENGITQIANDVIVLDEGNISVLDHLNGWFLVRGDLERNTTLTVSGTAHIILEDGNDLAVTESSGGAGIYVSEGNSLSIYAQSTGNNMGKLAVNYAIGGGYNGNGGTITINGGTVTGGINSNGGTITINGGTVIATSGIIGGTFTLDGNAAVYASSVSATGENRILKSGILFVFNVGTGTIFEGTPVTASFPAEGVTAVWRSWNGKSGIAYASDGINGFIGVPGVTLIEREIANNVPYIDINGEMQTKDNVTVILAENIATASNYLNGWYLVRGEIIHNATLTVSDEAHIILKDSSSLAVQNAWINVSEGNSLSIYAQSTGNNMGKLAVNYAIGGGYNGNGGTITINGGTVAATSSISGTVTINGGTVTATGGISGTVAINGGTVAANGGSYSAGIGGDGGTVTISGGTVMATGSISGSTVTISGGTVTATGGISGAITITGGTVTGGISGSTVTISGGTVEATGDSYGSTVTISGGTVTATGNIYGNTVTISDGTVTATGNIYGNTVTISDGTVTATGNIYGYTVTTISGGTVAATGNVGSYYGGGTFTLDGNAVVFASSVASTDENITLKNGILFIFNIGTGTILDGTPIAAYFPTEGVTAKWENQDSKSGITYARRIRNSFLEVPGVTVIERNSIDNVPYIDEKGIEQIANDVIVLDEENISVLDHLNGWFLISGDLERNAMLRISGEAHIILEDGSSLAVTGSYQNAGINVSEGNSLSIYAQSTGINMGKLAINYAIGGGYIGNGGTITINGGTVMVTGNISGSTVTISGGTVTATGSIYGSTFTLNGNAVVFASSVSDNNESRRTGGILFIGNSGKVYGNIELQKDLEIESGYTLTLLNKATLKIPSGITLTNNGTITPNDGSTIIINGTVNGKNKIDGAGTFFFLPSSKTSTSITLDTPYLLANTGQTIEYAINQTNEAPTSGWQTETTFADLTEKTTYWIFARSKEDTHFAAGTVSVGLWIDTKGIPTANDLAFAIPTRHIYNGTAQGIGDVTGVAGMGAITIYYNGSPDKPINAGTYVVTVDVADGTEFIAADGIVLGEYEITEATPILSHKTAKSNLLTPTQNGITLTANTNATVAVYNLSGKLINRQNYNAGSHSISLGHLPKGMYIVKASHGSEKEILRVQVR